MSLLEPFSGPRPGANAGPGPEPPRPEPGAARFLLARDIDPHRESLRVTVGFIALAAVSAILLNIGIYQSDRSQRIREQWSALEMRADDKVADVRAALGAYAHQAELLAMQNHFDAHEGRSAAMREAEIQRIANAQRWADIEVHDAAGTPRLRARRELPASVRTAGLVAHARKLRRTAIAIESRRGDQPAMLVAAAPNRDDAARGEVVVVRANLDEVLRALLMSWPGYGPSSGAYLTAREDGQIVILSAPPTGFGLTAGARNGSSSGAFRAAAIAATGAESRVEIGERDPLWTVTRWIPELGVGMVAQARRAELAGSPSTVFAGLVALDFAMVLLVGAAVVFWRRQYESGLAERELAVTRRHANQIQAVFDNAFDAILTFDRHGRLRTANPAAEAMFRRTAAELDGQHLASLLHHEDAQGRFQFPETGRVVRCEVRRGDGSNAPIELSIACAGEGDERIYTAIARDIGKQVEAENQIRSFAQGLETSNRRLAELNAQLEEASRLKSEFLANTSHELRTPLNGMIGFLQLVLDEMCSSPEEERDFLRQALSCSRHLLGLINDVLDIAKIEAGKLSLEIQEIDVRTLFDEVYTVTHVQAAQKGVELRFEAPSSSSVGVRGDFRKIKQVLINLVGNSIKFTPQGTVTVRATDHPSLGHWMFEVIDTGIGIPPDRQSRIFEKFIQGDGSTTRRFGGTGLGLAISRSLIELMGGIIGVHSEGEGRGTRMFFSLPTWHHEVDELPSEHLSERIEGPAGGPVVLIVEDDPTFRRFVSSLLHLQGYRTVEARHAEGGWMLARRLRPAIVVLDYALSCPEGASIRSGWDLAERMTTDPKTRHIPLVFVTGFDQQVKDKLRATAFARRPEHLVKPVDGTALLAKIESLLGSLQDRTVRVLMADDDATVVAYVRKALPEDRFHIEVANDGEECLHILRVQPRGFDLLLLDLMMPGVSGYDVLRELTLTGEHADLPVLILTNFPEARNDEERRLLEQGLVLDVLPKSSVHDNPMILPHIIDWHMQVRGGTPDTPEPGDIELTSIEPERRKEAA